ncbi:hypothetical protein AB0B51_07150, partial [Streptomyces griseus]
MTTTSAPTPSAPAEGPRPPLTHQEALAAARALAPRLRDHAPEADRLRTLPDAAVRLLDEAHLFDLLTPRGLGGLAEDRAVHDAHQAQSGAEAQQGRPVQPQG